MMHLFIQNICKEKHHVIILKIKLIMKFYINDRKCIVRKTDMMIEREISQKKYERNDTVCPILEEFS